MGSPKYGFPISLEERVAQQVHVVCTRKTQERKIFMEELGEYRKLKFKKLLRTILNRIGPKWYQALSENQRRQLDVLKDAIYQDILLGLPTITATVIKKIGLYPQPCQNDLLTCVYLGRNDPKEMLANLFLTMNGYSFDIKRLSYSLNEKLILSSIFYLGLKDLLQLLKERFSPDPVKKKKRIVNKPKARPVLESPYLQHLKAHLWERPRRKPFKPAPLPTLDDLNDASFEEDPPPMLKLPQPPPPPPPPKKRTPRSVCDKIAGIITIEPSLPATTGQHKTVVHRSFSRRTRGSKMLGIDVKKTYGAGGSPKRGGRRKIKAPSTGLWNSQYTINGIYTINGKKVFVLGNVVTMAPLGELIHGGHKYVNGEYITVIRGYRAKSPPPVPPPCDCVAKWHDTAFEYIKRTKCSCGHYYDYKHAGTFPPDELPFFEKPTPHSPFKMNYHTIYDFDSKGLHMQKEFKRIWETDSMLRDGTQDDKKDKKKKKRRSSGTCLGDKPLPTDYLKCALRLMRHQNIAARLPDIHLTPELKEWMRLRIHGPYTDDQKQEMMRKSYAFWSVLHVLAKRDYGHVKLPPQDEFKGRATWRIKQMLYDKFKKFCFSYKVQMFRSQAHLTNMLWTTMYPSELPDKNFREIFFSYMIERIGNLQLWHPYDVVEVQERAVRKKYICKPDNVDAVK